MATMKIGLVGLNCEGGSVELPEDTPFWCCPNCGQPVADKGQCCVEFIVVPSDDSKTGFAVTLSVDCRKCGCIEKLPAVGSIER